MGRNRKDFEYLGYCGPGGFGIHLIKNHSDGNYHHLRDGKNELTLAFRAPQENRTGQSELILGARQ